MYSCCTRYCTIPRNLAKVPPEPKSSRHITRSDLPITSIRCTMANMTDSTPVNAPVDVLPGELEPVPMTWARAPISHNEALGVARRFARAELVRARGGQRREVPDALPTHGEQKSSVMFRLDEHDLAVARARAEAEGINLTAVVAAALSAYAAGRPGTPTSFEPTYPHQ